MLISLVKGVSTNSNGLSSINLHSENSNPFCYRKGSRTCVSPSSQSLPGSVVGGVVCFQRNWTKQRACRIDGTMAANVSYAVENMEVMCLLSDNIEPPINRLDKESVIGSISSDIDLMSR